jgi:hypothetical protein
MTMKNICFVLVLIFLAALPSGCEKNLTSEGVSKQTWYVTFELTNGALVTSPKGTAFSDPGIKAMEGQTDVTSKVTVSGSVNTNAVGLYTLTYSATNVDGFSASVSRSVIVFDPAAPATDISGNYRSNVTRVSPARAFTGLSVEITKTAPGIFHVSDLLGGFYDQGANYRYGPTYAMYGFLQLNADNSLSYVDSYCPGFGDSLNNLTNGVFNPVTKEIAWTSFYTASNYKYLITLALN